MLKNPKHRYGPAEQPVTFPTLDPSVALHGFQPLMTGVAEFNGKAYAGWVEINRQWTTFLSGRFQEDVALVHRLAQCRNPQDIFGVYTEFFQKAFADYQSEFAEITRLRQETFAPKASTTQKAISTATRDE
jgi:hypothetical protein